MGGSVLLSATTTTPPGSPSVGDTYYVPTGASGAWSSHVGSIAVWTSGSSWQFAPPVNAATYIAADTGGAYLESGGMFELVAAYALPVASGSDATASVQAAIDTGAAIIHYAPTTYSITQVTYRQNQVHKGAGQGLTVLQKRAGDGNTMVVSSNPSNSNYTFEDMTLDGNGFTGYAYSLFQLALAGSNATIRRVTFQNGGGRPVLRSDFNAPVSNIRIEACEFLDSPEGGIDFNTSVDGHRSVFIVSNYWSNVGGGSIPNCCILGDVVASRGNTGCWFDVHIDDNTWTHLSPAAIPCEPWSFTSFTIQGNIVDGGSRGVASANNSIDGDISNNVISNQSIGGMELGACSNLHVHDNVFVNCNQGIYIDNIAGATVSELVIEDNLFSGTGLTSYNASNPPYGIVLLDGTATVDGLYIRHNVFHNMEYISYCIRILPDASTSGYIAIEDNVYYGTTYPSTPAFIAAPASTRVYIARNRYYRTVYIDAAHYLGPAFVVMYIPTLTSGSQCCFEANVIEMSGSAAGTYFSGIGTTSGYGNFFGLDIRRNRFAGNFGTIVPSAAIDCPTLTSDLVVIDNDLTEVVSGTKYNLGTSSYQRDLFSRLTDALTVNTANLYTRTMLSGNAVVTTDSLSTAAGSSQAITLNQAGVVVGDLVQVTWAGGTTTAGFPVVKAVTGGGTIAVTIYNAGSSAFNGTLVLNVQVTKQA